MALSALASRKKELEKAMHFLSAQHAHNLSEAAKYARKLKETRSRLDEINRLLKPGGKSSQQGKTGSGTSKKPSSSSAHQRFRTVGPTTVIVRLLYEHRDGMTNFEMHAHNGIAIKGRVLRKIIGRLLKAGCARRNGTKVVLTDQGIGLWEASPLFLHSSRDHCYLVQ
jgi:hypothetical protein